jgi:hypothetical protein
VPLAAVRRARLRLRARPAATEGAGRGPPRAPSDRLACHCRARRTGLATARRSVAGLTAPLTGRRASGCALSVAAALAGCAGAAPSAPVADPPVSTRDLPPPATPAPVDYRRELDELFRALAERDDRHGRASGSAAATTSPAAEAAYGENLATCLDGRWSAFCDHERLSPYDHARVIGAEYRANQATCIDPRWQHLCRPELLPDPTTLP